MCFLKQACNCENNIHVNECCFSPVSFTDPKKINKRNIKKPGGGGVGGEKQLIVLLTAKKKANAEIEHKNSLLTQLLVSPSIK